jgi:hypothetical protein
MDVQLYAMGRRKEDFLIIERLTTDSNESGAPGRDKS